MVGATKTLVRPCSIRPSAEIRAALTSVSPIPQAIFAMVFTGARYSFESARILESSANSPAGVPVWPLKLLIFAAGLTLLAAGIAEVMRCLVCIKNGRWPARSGDVEELEVVLQAKHGSEVKA
jgi:TRAP-type mannitol/chloroaromatic compound transport system permease small subunit